MTKKLEKRKVLLFLPLIAFPFIALGFYALGGGQNVHTDDNANAKGINMVLPDAQFKKEDPADKMEIYKQAQQDTAVSRAGTLDALAFKLGYQTTGNDQTKQINEKLSAINREINTPYVASKPYVGTVQAESTGNMSKDVEKLQMLMQSMKSDTGEDAEMKQLSGILQSIQEIQNPQLARQKYLKSDAVQPDSLFSAIPAVIAESQRAIQGSVVKLRLLDSVVLSGHTIPKGHEVFGLAEFSNQRLNLEIRNIRLGNQIIPVNLTVFDKRDAMRGINAPDVILTDAVNSGSSDAIGAIGIEAFDQNFGVQVAGAGIEAAKSMLTKRLKKIKQPLKMGYQVLLRDNTRKLR